MIRHSNNIIKDLLVLAYLLVCSGIIFKSTKQTYGVNDDVIMENWLSGFYTGRQEFMVRGSATPKITFGFIVSNLYRFLPDVSWFSIVLLSSTVFAWLLIGILAIRANDLFSIAGFGIASFLHLLWFIPNPTYTAASVLLSFSTLVYLAKIIHLNKLNFGSYLLLLVYLFAYFMRPESFLLGTAAATPFLVFSIWQQKSLIKHNYKIFLIFIIILGSAVAIDSSIERNYYKNNSNWSSYKDWESARYKIQANEPERLLLENPTNFGWTKSSAEVFVNYNAIDRSYFSPERLNSLILNTNQDQKLDIYKFLSESHKKVFDPKTNFGFEGMLMLILLFFILYLFNSFPRIFPYLILAGSVYLILYLIMIYVAGFLRQPERVQVSVIFLTILASLVGNLFAPKLKSNVQTPSFFVISVVVLFFILSHSIPQGQYLRFKVAGAPNVFWISQVEYLSKFPKDSIFVGNASQFRNNWISPYKFGKFEVENRIFTFGWHNFSPHWDKRAEKLGLDPMNIMKSIIEDPKVYWVSDNASMTSVIQFMREQGYQFTTPKVVGEMQYVEEKYLVWDFNK
jgi:hypothetical protein